MAKKDPPGTRYKDGKKMVPFQGPKPRKRSPGETQGSAGGYSAPYDSTGVPPEMQETLRPRTMSNRRKPKPKRRGY